MKAIFQCPQNLRATCTKRRKNDFLPWRRDAESPVFPPTWKPESLKKEKQNESGNARRKDIKKKPCGKTWHILYRKESSKNKRQHSVRFPTRENPLFATAPVPACKYAILVSQKMTICHFGSYATNCPQARVPPRLSLAWIRGGRNAHGGHAGKCSRRGCCAAHRTSGLP